MCNCNYIKDTIDKLVKKHNTTNPLEIIKSNKNLTLTFMDLSSNINGLYKYSSEKVQMIIINKNIDEYSKMFTLFHELGHSKLGHRGALLLNSPTTKDLKEEYEADLFATYFFIKHNCIKKENIDNIVMPKRAKELAHKFLPYIF